MTQQTPTPQTAAKLVLPAGYTLSLDPPTPAEHRRLRIIAGLSPPPEDEDICAAGLRSSTLCVVVREAATQQAIAMGRMVGDGQLSLLIVDMAVDPAHQRKGLGGVVLQTLLDWKQQHCPHAYLCLLADPPGMKLYARHGFEPSIEQGMTHFSGFVGDSRRRKAAAAEAAAAEAAAAAQA